MSEQDEEEPDPELNEQALRTEYVQAGQEARYRHTRMQNSYYLILILNAAFAGALAGPYENQNWIVVVLTSLLAGISITFLTVTIVSNDSKRLASWNRRTFIEREVDHDIFRIQHDTIGQRAEFDNSGAIPVYDPRDKNWLERRRSTRIPFFFALSAAAWFGVAIWALWMHCP